MSRFVAACVVWLVQWSHVVRVIVTLQEDESDIEDPLGLGTALFQGSLGYGRWSRRALGKEGSYDYICL